MKTARPAIITELIQRLSELPGVGQKTAERYVYFLVNQPKDQLDQLGHSISRLANAVTKCHVCNRIAEQSPCDICKDTNRESSLLCVVAESQDIAPMENTGHFKGRYHVLGGVLNALDGITPETLTIKQLVQRVTKDNISEVLMALNPDLEGESTALYIAKILKDKPVKVTRLARGLPMGSDVAYADEVTLSSAIDGRQEIN